MQCCRIALGLCVLGCFVLSCQVAPRPEALRPGGPAAAPTPAAPTAAAPTAAAPTAAAPVAPLTALRVAKWIQQLAGRLGEHEVEILVAKREREFFRIEYRVAAKGAERQLYFVTHDGAYATHRLIDMVQRIEQLKSERALTDCLVAKGVKIFVVPGEPQSDEQIAAMGYFGGRVLINCGGVYRRNCEHLGYKTFPVFVWSKGIEVGLRQRPAMLVDVGCR